MNQGLSYISNADLMRDSTRWALDLPHFDAFVGVPRGGTIPATILSCIRNTRMLSLEHLMIHQGNSLAMPGMHALRFEPTTGGRVLIVDDNVSPQAKTYDRIRQKLVSMGDVKVFYSVLYRSDPSTPVDFWYKDAPYPIFEFDYHRRHYARHAGFDIDGVLCEDYCGDEQNEEDPHHLNHLALARPQIIPRDRVLGVVSGRLERHRAVTESWLSRHGVRYQELILYPGSLADRRRAKDSWRPKAEFLARPDVWFFVESCTQQSRKIHEATGKPVLCTANGQMLQRT